MIGKPEFNKDLPLANIPSPKHKSTNTKPNRIFTTAANSQEDQTVITEQKQITEKNH